MADNTTIRSWPSLVIGAGFAALTGWTLTADVVAGAPFTPAQGLSIGAIVAAIASGHYAWPALKRGDVIRAAMLGIIFIAATAFVTVASAMKNAETGATKAARITANNEARQRETTALASSERALASAQGELQRGCVDSSTPKANRLNAKQCDGLRSSIAGLTPMIVGYKAALKDLGPELAPNGGYKAAAKALASLSGINAKPEAIEERLVEVMPFMAVLIGELATIVFIGLGLRHVRPVPAKAITPAAPVKAPAPRAPVDPKPRTRRTTRKDEARADVIQFRRPIPRPSLPTVGTSPAPW